MINPYTNSIQILESGALSVLLFTGENTKLGESSYELWLDGQARPWERANIQSHTNISKNNVALRALRKKYENAVIPLGSKLFSVDRKGIHLS